MELFRKLVKTGSELSIYDFVNIKNYVKFYRINQERASIFQGYFTELRVDNLDFDKIRVAVEELDYVSKNRKLAIVKVLGQYQKHQQELVIDQVDYILFKDYDLPLLQINVISARNMRMDKYNNHTDLVYAMEFNLRNSWF